MNPTEISIKGFPLWAVDYNNLEFKTLVWLTLSVAESTSHFWEMKWNGVGCGVWGGGGDKGKELWEFQYERKPGLTTLH